jgi:thioesterase domain-containing protein
LVEWAKNRIAWEKAKRNGEAGDAVPNAFHNTAIEAAFRTAIAHYEAHDWSGPLALFRPPLDKKYTVSHGNFVSNEKEYVFFDNDWTKHAPRLQVFEVPGTHDSMVLEPNVRVMAAKLRQLMEEAEPAALARAAE